MELPGAPSPLKWGLPPQGPWTHFLSAAPRKISQANRVDLKWMPKFKDPLCLFSGSPLGLASWQQGA